MCSGGRENKKPPGGFRAATTPHVHRASGASTVDDSRPRRRRCFLPRHQGAPSARARARARRSRFFTFVFFSILSFPTADTRFAFSPDATRCLVRVVRGFIPPTDRPPSDPPAARALELHLGPRGQAPLSSSSRPAPSGASASHALGPPNLFHNTQQMMHSCCTASVASEEETAQASFPGRHVPRREERERRAGR